MTPDQIKLVQESFARVVPIADQAADLFYDRLFEIAPDVRPLFPDDMAAQKRKLMQTLSAAVGSLDRVEEVQPVLEDLGRSHVGYGAKPEYYDTVGEALIWTLGQGLGEAFNPAVEEAWTRTYTLIAEVMKTAAAEVTEA